MRTHSLRIALFLVLLLTTSLAQGQVQRTFVSAHTGSDANPCGPTQPCRSFSTAIAQTLPGGEVIVLDSGGYGVVTITQSISIISPPGIYAGVTAFSGTAITIGTASLTVVLEGLTLNGLGATDGIGYTQGGTLYVKHCLITGFSNTGISLYTAGTPGAIQLFMADTDIRNIGSYGLFAYSNSGSFPHRITLDHVRMEKSPYGIGIDTNVLLNASQCVFAANTISGVEGSGGNSEANLESCLITHNANGVRVTYSGVRISNCTITDNTIKGLSLLNPGGSIVSRQNNTIEGNHADDTPTTYAAK